VPVVVHVKMIGPSLGSWIEQPRHFAGDNVDRCDIGALESIAVEARKGEIRQDSLSSMFFRYKVIRFVRKEGLGFS
jgi:hypothetical protein